MQHVIIGTVILRGDVNDRSRTVAPLKPAADAVELDSTSLTIDEVEAQIVQLIEESLPTLAQLFDSFFSLPKIKKPKTKYRTSTGIGLPLAS